jgi:hypothetical protein
VGRLCEQRRKWLVAATVVENPGPGLEVFCNNGDETVFRLLTCLQLHSVSLENVTRTGVCLGRRTDHR